MIAFVRGPVTAIEDDTLIINIDHIGIRVAVPLTMLQPRPVIGEEIMLYTHLQVREDAWTLYGFTDREQLYIFRLLLNVSGVGAKTALSIVDKIPTARFGQVIAAQDAKPFISVSGVGKKTAERILLELKDKFPTVTSIDLSVNTEETVTETLNHDLVAALKSLGYTATEARAFALQAQNALPPNALTETLLREALKIAMTS